MAFAGAYEYDSSGQKIAIDEVEAKGQSEKALLVEIGFEDFWIPFSQIDDDSEVYQRGDEGTIIITRWIAEKKGLI